MFTFNLQSLLNHKKFQEKVLKRELAESKATLSQEEKKLGICRASKDRLVQRIQESNKLKPSVSEIRLHSFSHLRLCDHVARQRLKVGESRRQSMEKRDHLVEAMKKRKILDKVKSKRLKRYRYLAARKEQEFINEIAVRQVHRNSQNR